MYGGMDHSNGRVQLGDNAGIVPRAVNEIFTELEKPEVLSSSVTVLFMQIYNENIYDLLRYSKKLIFYKHI